MVALLVVLVVLLGRSSAQPVPASVLADSAAYPEWAHYHWVWLASRDSNQVRDEGAREGVGREEGRRGRRF